MPEPLSHWLSLAAAVLLIGAYECLLAWRERRHPDRVARSAHGRLRADWVGAMSRERGMEIVAVQLLRNSLMSATINASTSALALTGGLTLMATADPHALRVSSLQDLQLRSVLALGLAALLFTAFVCSATAMRYYHHAGYAMAMPVGSPERERVLPMAVHHVTRGGVLYSWGLRFFLQSAPLLAGLVHPFLMPPAALALLAGLRRFDQVPADLAE